MSDVQGPCRSCGHPIGFVAAIFIKLPPRVWYCMSCRRAEESKITYYIKIPGGYTSVRI
jgi:hypothetical protein